MNSLYLILIGLCFTVGVAVTTMGQKNIEKMKPVCEDKKTHVMEDSKVVSKENNHLDSWFNFDKK